jgi:hypothetical protein
MLGDFLSCRFINVPPDPIDAAVVPTVEAHFTTPLSHRGSSVAPIGGNDVVDLTAGATVGIGCHPTLAIGGPCPLPGRGRSTANCWSSSTSATNGEHPHGG